MNESKALLPWVGNIEFWQWAKVAQSISFPLNLKIPKKSFSNRLYIAHSHGKQQLGIPLAGGRGNKLPYNEIKMSLEEAWADKLLLALQSAYGKSPFFEYYLPEIERMVRNTDLLLYEYNLKWLEWVRKRLKLEIRFSIAFEEGFSPNMYIQELESNLVFKPYPQVFRNQYSFIPNLSALDLIFCMGPKAAEYI